MKFTIQFPGSARVAALGQGTWHMGKNSQKMDAEADAIRYGLDLGLMVVDTAEMYHDAERVVARAIAGRRDDAYVVSKVLPSNASMSGTMEACERSLERLQIECIDLYLLHWVGSYPVSETLEAFNRLVEQGKIGAYGVSNFDTHELQDVVTFAGQSAIATNQILYNLECRGVEWDLLPWCRDRNIPVMAYSPLNQGDMNFPALANVATRHNVNARQVALAWLLHQQGVCVIPKSSNTTHIKENYNAAFIKLDEQDLKEIDDYFPAPKSPTSLQMI
jgi:diketogulonate reductase-like aldo/keto reductase